MLTKTFNVVIPVYGCNNCPYNNQLTYCEKVDYDNPEDYEKLENENRFELTTCPMLKE